MSKFVHVPNGDYKIQVQEGGKIIFDTGIDPAAGTVLITGDLVVEGTTTTVNTQNVFIEDNIIELNVIRDEETGNLTIPEVDESGIKFNRHQKVDTYIKFREGPGYSWRDPITETTIAGLFSFVDDNDNLVGIRTNSITTGGGDLYLINSGTGTISVTGTDNYELHVTDDDDITNKKYVDDAITTAFATIFLKQIGDGTIAPSSIIVDDDETTGSNSVINFRIDNQLVSQLYADRWEFSDIRIAGTTIETITSDADMTIRAPGSGLVKIDDTLQLTKVPGDDDLTLVPSVPLDGIKIYVNDESTGDTGLFFVSDSGNRDEIVSKNRALLFSMLF